MEYLINKKQATFKKKLQRSLNFLTFEGRNNFAAEV